MRPRRVHVPRACLSVSPHVPAARRTGRPGAAVARLADNARSILNCSCVVQHATLCVHSRLILEKRDLLRSSVSPAHCVSGYVLCGPRPAAAARPPAAAHPPPLCTNLIRGTERASCVSYESRLRVIPSSASPQGLRFVSRDMRCSGID